MSRAAGFRSVAGAFLLHPATVLLAAAAGIALGLSQPALAERLALPGTMYLRALCMCVLPLIISATILSVARLLESSAAGKTLAKLAAIFACGMVLAGLAGMAGAKLGNPGRSLAQEQKVLLGREIMRMEAKTDSPRSASGGTLARFLQDSVPENVFRDVSQGNSLPVLVFCIILGIALGAQRTRSSTTAIAVADATYAALLKIVSWLMYGLPPGLFCLLAAQMGQIGAGVLAALFKLVLWMSLVSLALVAIDLLVIWHRAGGSLPQVIRALKQGVLVAMGTSSSLAAIPAVIEGLHGRLGFRKETVDLVIPLGTTLNPHGNMASFGMMALFVAQLYDVTFNWGDWATILVASILAGVAASSAPALVSIAMVSMVLEPFGLPPFIGIVVLTVINPLVDPLLTLANVMGNAATAALVADKARAGLGELSPG